MGGDKVAGVSTKAQAELEQIRALPLEEQRDVWRELGQHIGQTLPSPPSELYGEPMTDDDLTESARVTFRMLDEEEKRAQAR